MRSPSSHIVAPLALAFAITLLVAESAHAQGEPAVQSYGVLNLLVPVPANVESNVSQAVLQDGVYAAAQGNLPMHEMVGVWSRAFARAGYDYDLSLYQALKGAGSAEYEAFKACGGIAYVIPLLNGIKEERREIMIESGWVGEATIEAAWRFGIAIGFLADTHSAPDAGSGAGTGENGRESLEARVRGLVQLADSIVFVWLESADGEDLGEFSFDAGSAGCQDTLEEGSMAIVEYVEREGGFWIEHCRKAGEEPSPALSRARQSTIANAVSAR